MENITKITDDNREFWKPNSKFFLLSLTPKYSDKYEADQCWHGCDKVSKFLRKIEYEILLSGGGGS